MNEASKTKSHFDEFDIEILQGKGIDIGCGNDPIFDNVRRFDTEDGDANYISQYIDEQFDFVFSAHCLEHMINPYNAIKEWWKLVKDGGHLYIIVPDEDLYEQGNWSSIFNSDHKHTFTIYKKKNESWSPGSINITDLIKELPDAKIKKIQLQDFDYDYSLKGKNIDQTLGSACAQICFVIQKGKMLKYDKLELNKAYVIKYYLFRILSAISFGKINKYFKSQKNHYKSKIELFRKI